MAASEAELAMRAMQLGALAAIRSEEYAAAHPAEMARRRLLEECRPRRCSGCVDATAEHDGL